MWFFLFGNKGYYDYLGYIVTKCPECRASGVFSVEQERKKFTVYFVPTFQYSKKQLIVCTNCHQRFEVADELRPEIARRLMSQKELSSVMPQKKLASILHCPSCQGELTEKMAYCPQCGRKLK